MKKSSPAGLNNAQCYENGKGSNTWILIPFVNVERLLKENYSEKDKVEVINLSALY